MKQALTDNSAMRSNASSNPHEGVAHDAFYRFVRVADVDAVAATLRDLTRDLKGSILVAGEGINGMLAGTGEALDRFRQALANDPRLGGRFTGIAFKRSACTTAPFQRMKVHRKPEVLPLGVEGVEAVRHQGTQLSPQAWRELMAQDDVVLIDNRNSFEFRLGRFRGAVDPQVNNFRDFPAWVEAQLPIWKAQHKRVAMYCTGGIRCEKTAAWMHTLGMPVLELRGGILNYFAQMPDAETDWIGECFVFDNRVALNTRLQETATRAEDVYGSDPDEAWRLQRALRLAAGSGATPSPPTGDGGGGGEISEHHRSALRLLTSCPTLKRNLAPLPTRDGVGPSCVALPEGPWPTIAAFLVQRFPAISASVWAARIEHGEVVDEHGVAVTPTCPHQPRLHVFYYRAIDAEPPIPFTETILFQDELLVAVDKPHFLPITPGGRYLQETLLVRLKRSLGIDTLVPIHRLDRETAGVVIFSVQPATRAAYAALFAQRQVTKHYEAIAPWRADLELPLTHRSRLAEDEHFMRMREVPGAANSETRVALLDVCGTLARYSLSPVTGRKHQLRVHCAALGIPICNDLLYPRLFAQGSDDFTRPLRLIARSLTFADPVSGATRHFASPRRQPLD